MPMPVPTAVPLPVPTTVPLYMPTVVPLPVPTAVPLPAPTVVHEIINAWFVAKSGGDDCTSLEEKLEAMSNVGDVPVALSAADETTGSYAFIVAFLRDAEQTDNATLSGGDQDVPLGAAAGSTTAPGHTKVQACCVRDPLFDGEDMSAEDVEDVWVERSAWTWLVCCASLRDVPTPLVAVCIGFNTVVFQHRVHEPADKGGDNLALRKTQTLVLTALPHDAGLLPQSQIRADDRRRQKYGAVELHALTFDITTHGNRSLGHASSTFVFDDTSITNFAPSADAMRRGSREAAAEMFVSVMSIALLQWLFASLIMVKSACELRRHQGKRSLLVKVTAVVWLVRQTNAACDVNVSTFSEFQNAAAIDGACINVIADMAFTSNLVIDDGTNITVTSSVNAVLDGATQTQLFLVYGSLSLSDITLAHGYVRDI